MKIHPSQHDFVEEDRIKQQDISLSCLVVDSNETIYDIDRTTPNLTSTSFKTVLPYDEFEWPDPYLYDQNLQRIEVTNQMIRMNSGYAFFPPNATEFYPEQFDYQVLLKNNSPYKMDRTYHITIGCIEEEYELAERLSVIFGNAYKRGTAPSNVIINNGDIKRESFSNMAIEECDFVFIASNDGIHYNHSGEVINFEEFLYINVNPWVVSTGIEDFDVVNSMSEKVQMAFNYANIYLFPEEMPQDILMTNHANILPGMLFDGYNKINLSHTFHTPALVYERESKGHLIITTKDLIMDGNNPMYTNLIYSILMEVYLQRYHTTDTFRSWITDDKVDYLPSQDSVFGRNHEVIHVSDLLQENSSINSNELYVYKVFVTDGDVDFRSLTPSLELIFEKKGTTKDPVRRANDKAYFTTRNSVILYQDSSVNLVEMPLTVRIEQTTKGNYAIVDRYISTSQHIDTLITQRIRIPDTTGTMYLCSKDNTLILVQAVAYEKTTHGIHLATVRPKINSVIKNYDARVFGGGLAEDKEDNFNLLDISHLDGRPHRKGGAFVITLPKRLMPYHEIITKKVDKHITAGDFYVISYQ